MKIKEIKKEMDFYRISLPSGTGRSFYVPDFENGRLVYKKQKRSYFIFSKKNEKEKTIQSKD